jgi:hypothetical protein
MGRRKIFLIPKSLPKSLGEKYFHGLQNPLQNTAVYRKISIRALLRILPSVSPFTMRACGCRVATHPNPVAVADIYAA